jgi:DNA-binding NarL/FixJ family response regulator
MIRVCLVEDQTIVREGLESLLRLTEDIRVVAQAGDGARALEVVRQSKPDVILLDIRMPQMNGISFLRELFQSGVTHNVLVLTTFDDDDALLEAIRLGARGFLLKDVTLQILAHAVREVAAGRNIMTSATNERILSHLQAPPKQTQPPIEALTQREVEVVRLISCGYSNREIGFALKLTEGTVKNYVSVVLIKLEARDRVRAVLRALELGYLHPKSRAG